MKPALVVNMARRGQAPPWPKDRPPPCPYVTDETGTGSDQDDWCLSQFWCEPRILQRVEMVHSPLKVVVGTDAGPIGQPWLSLLIDYTSRMVVGFCLGFEPPSYAALMSRHNLDAAELAEMRIERQGLRNVQIVDDDLAGAVGEALQRGNEQIEMDDLARIFERCLAQQRVLAEQSNPFIGDLDKSALDRVQAADQTRTAGVGLSPRASGAKHRPAKATDSYAWLS